MCVAPGLGQQQARVRVDAPPSAVLAGWEQLRKLAGCSLVEGKDDTVSKQQHRRNEQGGGWLTLDKLSSVWAVGELLLEGVPAGGIRAGDGGLVDLDFVDLWNLVFLSHDWSFVVLVVVVVLL